MVYAKISNGSVVKYPYTLNDLRIDNPGTSFPGGVWPGDKENFGVVEVQPADAPIPSQMEVVEEATQTLVDGVWTQAWSVRSFTTEEVAQAQMLLQGGIVKQVQQRLDAFAQTRNYDGILSACTYATSSVPSFQAEGQCCVDARDATWSALYQILAAVQSGNWPTAGAGQVPTGYADIEGQLPDLEWPQ